MTTPNLLAGRYRLGEIVGFGGMSEVHRATDTVLGREVAVKIMRPDLARDETFYQRFRREAQNSASLNHPSIVAVYDTGEEHTPDGDLPYIVMELVEGDTLRDLVKMDGPLESAQALGIMADACGALDFSHRKGIIHRDVKPANIMLSHDGAVKVMDFGIARAVSESTSSLTQTSAVLGTAQYLSPEQARGETVDARSDVYSAGCVLYEALTGVPPFTGESPVAVAYQHVQEDAPVPSSVNPDLDPYVDAVVMNAMAKNPANRYQSAGEMRTDLIAVLDGRRPSAPLLLGAAPYDDEPEPAPRRGATRSWRSTDSTGSVPAVGLGAGAVAGTAGLAGATGRHDASEAPTEIHPTGSGGGGTGGVGDGRAAPVPVPAGSRSSGARQSGTARRRSGGVGRPRPLALAAAALLALALVGVIVWWRSGDEPSADDPGTTQVQEVTVPEVANRPEKEVTDQLTALGLTVVPRPQPDPRIPAGLVVASDPIAGKRLPAGSQIQLVVSSGKPILTVPNITGMAPAEARKALQEAGFEVPPTQVDKPSTPEDAGHVLGSDPAPGVQVPSDRPVTYTVGTGPEEVTVPGVVGQQLESARAALQQAGFRVDTTSVDSTEPAEQVIGQSTTAGQRQVRGASITLQVSAGNRFRMPNLVNLTVPQALDALAKAGWKGGPAQLVQLPQADPDLTRVGKIYSQQPTVGEVGVRDQVVVRVIQFGLIPGPG